MKKILIIIAVLLVALSSFASSNGGVRAIQPERVPVILANFSNVQFHNTDYAAYKASLEKYFADNSFGKYTPVFDLIGPVQLSKKAKYYGENDYYDNDLHADEMVAEACNLAEDLADFTLYDQDGDGKLDAVVIIYAGQGEVYGVSNQEAVWAYTANLEESDEVDYYVTLDGKTVTYFSAVPELQDSKNRDGIGTLVHEFAHILGLPNLCTTNGGYYKTLGDWDVMDHGSYNNQSNTPAAFSAYERFFLGWVEPILLDGPMNVRLRDLNKTGDCAIITASGQSNLSGISPDPREFYILENRQQEGWDEFIPGHGLMLTKIDYVKNKWESDEVNNIENHPCVDLIEAGGGHPKYDPHNLTNGFFGNELDLFPHGATSYQMFSNKMYFENVTEKNGVITFDFNGGVGKCEVKFYVGEGGSCATQSLTESKKGAGVVLPAVTAKSGYTFKGWTTRKNSNVANAGQPGDTYYPMSDCTLFAVMQDNSRYWAFYDYKGVQIGNYIGWKGAYVSTDDIQDIAVTFVKKDGYLTPAPATCMVKVVCGGKQLKNAASFKDDVLTVSIPAASITGDIYITIVNVREQTEEGCADYTHTFTGTCYDGSMQDFSGYNWNVTIANTDYLGYDKKKGAQFGSNTYPAGKVSLYTEETMGCAVATVRIKAATSGDGVLSVYYAGKQVGETEELLLMPEIFEFNVPLAESAALEIRLENTQNAIFIKQIEILYTYLEEPEIPSAIEDVTKQESTINTRKMLIDGQLIIIRNDVKYNTNGQMIL